MTDISLTCPHCDTRLSKWLVPDDASWDDEFFYVCFNNDCSYYKDGWTWMETQFKQKASYRFALNPNTGASSPLPVWSDSATRQMIVDENEGSEE